MYHCKPEFYYIKMGFKGVKIIYACFRDVYQRLSCVCSSSLKLWPKFWTQPKHALVILDIFISVFFSIAVLGKSGLNMCVISGIPNVFRVFDPVLSLNVRKRTF